MRLRQERQHASDKNGTLTCSATPTSAASATPEEWLLAAHVPGLCLKRLQARTASAGSATTRARMHFERRSGSGPRFRHEDQHARFESRHLDAPG